MEGSLIHLYTLLSLQILAFLDVKLAPSYTYCIQTYPSGVQRIWKDKTVSGPIHVSPACLSIAGFFICEDSPCDLWQCTLEPIFSLLSQLMKSRGLLCRQLLIMQH